MQQEATDELVCRSGHGFLLAAIAIILVTKGYLAVLDVEDAIVLAETKQPRL